jgi:hypothetical protein
MQAAWYCTFRYEESKHRAEYNAQLHQNSDRINAANKRKWRYSDCYTDAFCRRRTLWQGFGPRKCDSSFSRFTIWRQLIGKSDSFLLGSNFGCWRRFHYGPGRFRILSCRRAVGRQRHLSLQRGNVGNRMFRYPNARHLNTNAFGVGSTWRLHGRWRGM